MAFLVSAALTVMQFFLGGRHQGRTAVAQIYPPKKYSKKNPLRPRGSLADGFQCQALAPDSPPDFDANTKPQQCLF